MLLSEECLRLQGLDPMIHKAALEIGMTDAAVCGAAGNAWPVDVVSKIIHQIKVAMAW